MMAANIIKSDNGPAGSPDITLVCAGDTKIPAHNVLPSDKRTKNHAFTLNVEEQVKRKINDADKVLLKIEKNEDDIKIHPNSGNFKVISEEVLNLQVGQEFKSDEVLAKVTDIHQQSDKNKVVFMVKTEFSVMDVKTGSTEKAVLHTYKSKTFFMIQGNAVMADKTYCKDFFLKKT